MYQFKFATSPNSLEWWTVSIHLMYQFKFKANLSVKLDVARFQYISCISSSFLISMSVYLQLSFQYISCISSRLSLKKIINIEKLFQYISCISSSTNIMFVMMILASFNTSHVSVQVYNKRNNRDRVESFNTSHVSVQDTNLVCNRWKVLVSIHLMYQFKYVDPINGSDKNPFQYISCISSSRQKRSCGLQV